MLIIGLLTVVACLFGNWLSFAAADGGGGVLFVILMGGDTSSLGLRRSMAIPPPGVTDLAFVRAASGVACLLSNGISALGNAGSGGGESAARSTTSTSAMF